MLKIKFSDLLTAFENHNKNITHYLDLKTGQVLFTADENLIEDVDNDTIYRVKKNPENFFKISMISPHDGFKIMENFTASIKDQDVRDVLSSELYRPKPFKSFKAVLIKYDDLYKEYSDYKNTQIKNVIIKWLNDNNINADLV